MTNKTYIKPGVDKDDQPYKVRKPTKPTEFLAEEGELVVLDKHWHRRLRDGSVVKADAPKAPAKPDKTTATTKG